MVNRKFIFLQNCRDAMGGDYAPRNVIIGAIQASKDVIDRSTYFSGEKGSDILNELSVNQLQFDKDKIIDADEVITMSDFRQQQIKTKQIHLLLLEQKQSKKRKPKLL